MEFQKLTPKKELKLPARLCRMALSKDCADEVRFLVMAKLEGHRAEIKALLEKHNISKKTGHRLANKIISLGWGTTDGKFLFCKSWKKLGYSQRGSAVIEEKNLHPKANFKGYVFASSVKILKKEKAYKNKKALKKEQANIHPKKTALKQQVKLGTVFPDGYYAEAFERPERTIKRYKAFAKKYSLITVPPQQFTTLGPASQYNDLRKNLPDVKLFIKNINVRGEKIPTVVHPEMSDIIVNLDYGQKNAKKIRQFLAPHKADKIQH